MSPIQDTVSEALAQEEVLHDIVAGEELQLSPAFSPLGLVLIIVVLAVIALFLFRFLRRKGAAPNQPDHLTQALQTLARLEHDAASQPVPQAAAALSSHLRQTLTTISSSRSAYQSREEFHHDDIAQTVPQEPLRGEIVELLDNLWQLEYKPPHRDASVMNSFYRRTERILQQLAD